MHPLYAPAPAVPVPLALDQPFWTRRLTALGASPAYVNARRPTARKLADALHATLHVRQYRDRCTRLSALIRSHDGAEAVLKELETVPHP
ncbi:hypothetical protein ABZ419_17065 [Streptomyces cinnamoneus]|uniref:hypothetical protein n=1 Tax=Streptomyces cinnamoneus TaxID=53446 RepID=UPI0033CE9069